MSMAVADEPLARSLAGLRDTRIGLAIGLAALALLFHAEIQSAVQTWIDSTAYNHCFLVIPIAGYLIWERRDTLRGLSAAPIPIVALLALPLGVTWLAAERLGILEGRQLVVVTMVEVLFLAILGWRLWYALLGPLLYLYFLVPFGEFLTPRLQDITAWFIRHGVDVLGIPAYIDGYVIDIPEGSFFVAEACAGLRFLIASIAFGVLYALLMYRNPGRRLLFVVASIITPIIANGFRALGIVALGHILGSAEAAAADHIVYGWIFFSIVILLLIVIGLPFREDDKQDERVGPVMPAEPTAARHGLYAGLAVTALAAFGPLVASVLNQASAAPELALRPLDLSPTCGLQRSPQPSATSTPGQLMIQTVDCDGIRMSIQTEVFAPRLTAGPLNAERRRLTRPRDAEDVSEIPLTAPTGDPLPPWRLIRANEPSLVSAAGIWIDGEPAQPGMAMRLRMAMTSIFGGSYRPVLMIVTPAVDWAHVDMRGKKDLEMRLSALLGAHPEIEEQLRTIARAAR